MPLVRYEIRSEYELANRELYRTAPKNDPEAILEGVAMVSLVGIVRQLGDLAEFAADIFHDLHEAVMATASRSHDLIARVSHLEGELPALEKAMFSRKTNQLQFAHAPGAEWHASIRNDQNHCTQGDLPRFIRSSYEECRGPPRLFLLDKFDVGGAGACLKRYTDPSFFKMEWASSELMKAEKAQQDKKARRGKKAKRRKAGDTKDSRQTVQLQPRVRYSSLSISSLDGLSETTTPLSTMPIGNDQINRSSPFATFLGAGSQQSSSKESTGSYPAKPAKSVRRFDLPKGFAATKINGTNLESEMLQLPKPNEDSNFNIEPTDRDEEAFKESMDDVASETDQYLDAMTTMESETDSEPRERRRFDINDFKPAMAALGSETDSDSKARQDDTDIFFEDARNSTMESETEAESQYSAHLTPIRVAPQLELEQDGEAPNERELELEQAFELEGDPIEPQFELEQEMEPAERRSKLEQAVEDVDHRVQPQLNLEHASEDVGPHLQLEQHFEDVSINKEQALDDSLQSAHNTLDTNVESDDGNISQHEKPKELDEDDILQHEQPVLESEVYEEHSDSEVEDDEQFDVEVIQVIGGVRDEVQVEPAVVLEEESTKDPEPRSKKGVDVDDSTSPVDMKSENEVDTLDYGDYIEIEPSLGNQTLAFEIAEGNRSVDDKFDRPVQPLDSSTVDGSLKEATNLDSIEAGEIENFIEPSGLGFEEANSNIEVEVLNFAEVPKVSSTKETINNDLASGPHEESAPSDSEFENDHGLKTGEETSESIPSIVDSQEIPVKDSSPEESNGALNYDENIRTVSGMDDFESATSQEDFSEEQSSSRFSDTGFSDENDLHDDGSPEMDHPHLEVHSRGHQMERDERGPSSLVAGGSENHDDLTKPIQSEETTFDWLPRSAIPLIPEVESGNEREAEQQHEHEERLPVEHEERFLDHGDLDEEQADTEADTVQLSRPQSPRASPAQSATGIGIILGNAISKGPSNAESPISSSTSASASMQLSPELPDERDMSGAVSPLSIKVSSPQRAISSEASSSSSPVSSKSSGSSSPKSPIFSALHAPMSPIRSEDHLRGGLSTMLTPTSPLLKTLSSSPKMEEMPPPPPLPPLRWRTAQSPGHYQATELSMPPLEHPPGRSEAPELFMPPPEQSPEPSEVPELFMPPPEESGRFEAPKLLMRPPDGRSEAPELFMLPSEQSPELLMSPPEQSVRRPELLMSPPEQSPGRSRAPELLLPPPEQSSGRSQVPEMLLPPAEQLPRRSQAPELLMSPPEQSPRRFEAPELLMQSPARRSQAPELLMSPPEQSPRRFEAPELLMPSPERRSQAPELLMSSPEQSPRRSQAPELMMPPPPLPPSLPDRTADVSDNQSLPVSTMSSKRSLADDALIHSISLHDRTKLKKVASEIRPHKAPDERGFLLEQIRSQSFNLRHTVVEKKEKQDPPPRLITNINVAAILEKANAIRQAFAGSDDDEDDDDWSDA